MMYICICNAVTESELSEHLKNLNGKTSARNAYLACTGGCDHVCGKCEYAVKDIVTGHNNNINVQQLANGTKELPPANHKESV